MFVVTQPFLFSLLMLHSNIWRLLQFIRHTFKIRFVTTVSFFRKSKETHFYGDVLLPQTFLKKNLCKVSRFVRHILKYSNVFLNPIDVCFTLFSPFYCKNIRQSTVKLLCIRCMEIVQDFFLQKYKPHLGLWLKKTVWLIVSYFFLLWGCILNLFQETLI